MTRKGKHSNAFEVVRSLSWGGGGYVRAHWWGGRAWTRAGAPVGNSDTAHLEWGLGTFCVCVLPFQV